MDELEKVSIDAGSKIFGLLQGMTLRTEFALAEFVDNALGSYLANKKFLKAQKDDDFKLEVIVNIDTVREVISIKDNAFGIAQSKLATALMIGTSDQSSILNEFGVGMKLAGFWFASEWSLRTKAFGEKQEKTLLFNVEDLEKNDTTDVLVAYCPAKTESHYTEVTLLKFNKNRFPGKHSRNKIEALLKEIYRRYYSSDEMELYFVVDDQEELLRHEDRPILKMPFLNKKENPIQKWKVKVSYKRDNYSVTGWVGLLQKSKIDSAGFDLFRRTRLVEWKWKPRKEDSDFNIFMGQRSGADARLFGELDFKNFEVSSNKNQIQWPAGFKEEFLEYLYFLIHYHKKTGSDGSAKVQDFWVMLESYIDLNKKIKNPESPDEYKQDSVDTVRTKLKVLHDKTEPMFPKNSTLIDRSLLSEENDLEGKSFDFAVTVTEDEKWLVNAILTKGVSSDPFFTFATQETIQWPRELTMRINISHEYFRSLIADQDTFEDKGENLISLYSYICIIEQYGIDAEESVSPEHFRLKINSLLTSLYS